MTTASLQASSDNASEYILTLNVVTDLDGNPHASAVNIGIPKASGYESLGWLSISSASTKIPIPFSENYASGAEPLTVQFQNAEEVVSSTLSIFPDSGNDNSQPTI